MFRVCSLKFCIVAVGIVSDGCAVRSNMSSDCSKIQSEALVNVSGSGALAEQLQSRDAPGGEIIIQFRKDGPLAKTSHQRSCTFFMEPSLASQNGAYIWTASHCLDPSLDSAYSLRFFVDVATGYVELPVQVESLERRGQLRTQLAKILSSSAQSEVLQALKPLEIDYSPSKNATDICLGSFKSGRSFFHEPETGKNQISCFLYQDLSLFKFTLSEQLTPAQKQVMSSALEKAMAFENSLPIPPTATIRTGTTYTSMSAFRENWISTYKTFSELRENDGFNNWTSKMRYQCSLQQDSAGSEICAKLSSIKTAFESAGLQTQASLFEPSGTSDYLLQYALVKTKVAELWKTNMSTTATINGVEKRLFDFFNLVSNYSWNSGELKTFTTIGLGGFLGLGWGATVDESGKPRDRVGAATYYWLPGGAEMFIYAITPKNQTTENLALGYAQLGLRSGDSGSMLLGGGLPMAILATVDGEKTSGGASILPLPEAAEEIEANSGGAQIQTREGNLGTKTAATSTMSCLK